MIDILKKFISDSKKKQWHPNWPIPSDIWNSNWPWLPVEFNSFFDFEAMHKECIANDHLFVGHRQKDRQFSYNHEGWDALTLHGISPTATENYEQYGFSSASEANYRWTEICKLFPACTEFVKSLNYKKYERVRIMRLAPGGYIMPHVDGPGRHFGALNVAINNPKGCEFYFKEWGLVPFKQGCGNFLDIGNEHIVWNNSNEPRYHFIIHGHDPRDLYEYTFDQFQKKYEPKSNIKIAYGVYNQRDRINNEFVYQRTKGTTLYYLERISNRCLIKNDPPIRIICRDEIHELLEQAAQEDFDYCVIQAVGCQLKNMDFHYSVLRFIIEADNFGIAGHPLWRTDGRWLELHHQFFIVNVKAWVKVGRPEYGTWEQDEIMLPVINRSDENFHDDYTPIWVKPTGKHELQERAGQGWKLLAAMFDHEYPVITLSEHIRHSKFYVYPDHETEKFEECIRTLTPYENQNWNQNKWLTNCKRVKDQIWLFNSENMKIPNQGPFDLVVTTASGFKLFDLFRTNKLTDSAEFIIYDFNIKSLEWFEHLYTWVGDDLLECIRAFPDRDHFTWLGRWDVKYNEDEYFNDCLKTVYDYFGQEEFKEYWWKFRAMPVDFHIIDLYSNPELLAGLMHGNGKKFINLTNIFSTDATQVIFGPVECMAAQTRCLGTLYVVDPTIEVTLYDYWNLHKFGPVRDILL